MMNPFKSEIRENEEKKINQKIKDFERQLEKVTQNWHGRSESEQREADEIHNEIQKLIEKRRKLGRPKWRDAGIEIGRTVVNMGVALADDPCRKPHQQRGILRRVVASKHSFKVNMTQT
jgi:hypothetical protein